MVRPLQIHLLADGSSALPLALALFVSASLFVILCAKHARKHVSKKEESNTSQLAPAKPAITTVKSLNPSTESDRIKEERALWQREILMGEKCIPPEFSGVIYYDYDGNRIPEMPKSPRDRPRSPFKNFTFPAETDDGARFS